MCDGLVVCGSMDSRCHKLSENIRFLWSNRSYILFIVEKRSGVTILTDARTDGFVKIEPEFLSQNLQ